MKIKRKIWRLGHFKRTRTCGVCSDGLGKERVFNPIQTGLMDFFSEVFFDRWETGEKGKGLLRPTHPNAWIIFKSLLNVNLGRFKTHPKLSSSMSLS